MDLTSYVRITVTLGCGHVLVYRDTIEEKHPFRCPGCGKTRNPVKLATEIVTRTADISPVLEKAGRLAALTGAENVRRHADADDLAMAYAMVLGEAQDTISRLLDVVADLTGQTR